MRHADRAPGGCRLPRLSSSVGAFRSAFVTLPDAVLLSLVRLSGKMTVGPVPVTCSAFCVDSTKMIYPGDIHIRSMCFTVVCYLCADYAARADTDHLQWKVAR